MGARWESVFLRGPRGAVQTIVARAECLVPFVQPPIQFSIAAFRCEADVWSLECAGFRKNAKPFLLDLPAGAAASGLDAPPVVASVRNRSCEFGLALVARSIVEEVSWVFYSDSLGLSALVRWKNGALVENSFVQSTGQGEDYERLALSGVREYLGDVRHVDDELFERVYSERPLVWMLMENKMPVSPPREEGVADV